MATSVVFWRALRKGPCEAFERLKDVIERCEANSLSRFRADALIAARLQEDRERLACDCAGGDVLPARILALALKHGVSSCSAQL